MPPQMHVIFSSPSWCSRARGLNRYVNEIFTCLYMTSILSDIIFLWLSSCSLLLPIEGRSKALLISQWVALGAKWLSKIYLCLLFHGLWTLLGHAKIFNRFEMLNTKANIAGVLLVSVSCLKNGTTNRGAMRRGFLYNARGFFLFRDWSRLSPGWIPLVLVEHHALGETLLCCAFSILFLLRSGCSLY
jgi:hypothetical protein